MTRTTRNSSVAVQNELWCRYGRRSGGAIVSEEHLASRHPAFHQQRKLHESRPWPNVFEAPAAYKCQQGIKIAEYISLSPVYRHVQSHCIICCLNESYACLESRQISYLSRHLVHLSSAILLLLPHDHLPPKVVPYNPQEPLVPIPQTRVHIKLGQHPAIARAATELVSGFHRGEQDTDAQQTVPFVPG